MRITDDSMAVPHHKRRYFVNGVQYTIMKNNQRICQTYRIIGHEACRRCKQLNFEKWRLCHTMPVEGSQHKNPEWKK